MTRSAGLGSVMAARNEPGVGEDGLVVSKMVVTTLAGTIRVSSCSSAGLTEFLICLRAPGLTLELFNPSCLLDMDHLVDLLRSVGKGPGAQHIRQSAV